MGRILFDPNSLFPEGDEVSPAAFLLRDLKEPEDYLSVFRTAFMELTRQFAENLIKKVPEDNSICGYAHLLVQDVHDYDAGGTLMVALPRPSRKLPPSFRDICDSQWT